MPRTPYYVTLYFSQKIICNRSVLSQNDVLPNDYFCLFIKEYGAAARTADPCATAPYNIYDIRSGTLSPILFYAFSILIAHTLYSGILAYLSSAALVSQFAFPSGKWNGIQLSPGEVFVPTRAVDSIDPRLEETLTLSPFLIPSLSASKMFISVNDIPSISISSGVFPVMALVE